MLRTERLTTGIAGASTLCLVGEAADVYAMRLHHGHRNQATTGSKQPRVPINRQRPMGGPAPADPDTFLGQHV